MKYLYLFLLCAMLSACVSNRPTKKSTGDDAMAIEERAENYYKNANLLLAEAEFQNLLNIAPRYSKAWFRLGNIYLRSNQLDAAITHYEKAIEIDPKLAKAWHNLALARIRQATNTLVEAQQKVEAGQTQEIDFLLKKLVAMQRAE